MSTDLSLEEKITRQMRELVHLGIGQMGRKTYRSVDLSAIRKNGRFEFHQVALSTAA